ncbi:MAG: glycosyltransferase [Thermoguttaceae bacterium]|nr:glycosyltransferase [Thermoguttaceae bacterium]
MRVMAGLGGGPEKTILRSPRALAAYGYRGVCVYLHPPGDPGFSELRQKAARLEATLLGIPDRGPWDLRVVSAAYRVCRRLRPAIWQGHDYKTNLLGLLISRVCPVRLVSMVHGWTVEGRRIRFYYRLDRLWLRFYERVICVSEDLRAECLRWGVRPERCVVIENAIDLSEYQRQWPTEVAKRRLGLPPDAFIVGNVGRLSPEKGLAGLVEAVAQLQPKFENLRQQTADFPAAAILGQPPAEQLQRPPMPIHLVLVGDGPQRQELAALAHQRGIADRVHLVGYQPDPHPWYEAMDLFVSNSIREGLPNVLLEAMAFEVPVVATRIAGVSRLIEPEQNGLLIEPGDQTGLTAAIGRLLADSELRRRLAQAGRHTVETRYNFQIRMAKVAAVYDDLLGRKRLSRGPR